MRDWFAGQALAASDWTNIVRNQDQLAEKAYAIADAMLAERAKGKK